MYQRQQLKQRVLSVSPETFEELALDIFHFQARENPVYRHYLEYRRVDSPSVKTLEQIPCMPLEFFKNHRILSGNPPIQMTFESSGTTGETTSRHLVADLAFYQQISQQLFEHHYGSLHDWTVLALLPSYLERANSSLVYMVQHFIEQSTSAHSGFFLHNTQDLRQRLIELSAAQTPVLLIGVTFALLDLAESSDDWHFLGKMPRLVVMETGGMKGRRREMLREEVHQQLIEAFGVSAIHSEYGMTELLSQAYSLGEGVFELPATMRLLLRDINDPLTYITGGSRSGGINLIDLANVDSCSFLETKDLGSYAGEGKFRVLGRFDNSDVRGCNLLVISA